MAGEVTKKTADLRAMLAKFGVVTVMNVKLYDAKVYEYSNGKLVDGLGNPVADTNTLYEAGEWDAKSTFAAPAAVAAAEGEAGSTSKGEAPFIWLDTLKVSNINAEGPSKTATGGMSADTLLKYGKKFTVEMTEAMGRYDVLDKLYGAKISNNNDILAITDRFPGEMTLVGDTFVIDQKTGAKQPIHIVIPRFLGNGVFNLTMDAEGDVTTFDLNGDILRYESEVIGEVGEDGKYGAGSDNCFYFICTDDGLEDIKKNGYRETFNAQKASGETV